jgi:hypothetical protein
MQPYRLHCGPFSGYSVSATLEGLSSGEWQIIVRLNPWLPELPYGERVFRRTFQDRVRAALELSDLLDTCEEMSQGPFVAPVTAY